MASGGATGGGGGKGGGYGNNPYNNASQGMQQAFNQTSGMMQSMPQAYGAQMGGYNPSVQGAVRMGGGGLGYNPATMSGKNMGYNAQMQRGPETIASQMGRYQNPWENQVVNRTANQMQRATNMQQNQNADAAIAAGAFGGGRHGVVEALTNAEGQQNIGDMTAQMRQQGFNTAAGLAGQDINNRMNVRGLNQAASNQQQQFNAGQRFNTRAQNQAAMNQARQFRAGQNFNRLSANQNARNAQRMANQQARNRASEFGMQNDAGLLNSMYGNMQNATSQLGNLAGQSFGMGNSINDRQMQQGAMAQQLQQAILSGGLGGFQQFANQPQNILNMRLQSLGVNPGVNATTTTQSVNPGWGTTLGNALQAGGNMFSFNPMTLPWGQGG